MQVAIEISPGELFDRLTILEIKAQRVSDPEKLRNVKLELDLLSQVRDRELKNRAELVGLVGELRVVNETLWKVEDDIRDCERAKQFDARFIELARSVYRLNDQRAALKRKINVAVGSKIVEEKSYQPY